MTDRHGPANRNTIDTELYDQRADHARFHGSCPGKSTLTSRLPARPPDVRKAARIDRDVADDGVISDNAEAALSRARSGSGRGLDAGVRSHLEAALGVSLSGVGVHTDASATSAADSIGANAYAEGQDIYFAAGQYDPGSQRGQRLIAHEVAHTVQQRGASSSGVQASKSVSQPGDAHELEADAFADAFVAGRGAPVISAASPSIAHRDKSAGDKGNDKGEFAELTFEEQKRAFRKADASERVELLDEVSSARKKQLFKTLSEQDRLWLLQHVSTGHCRNLVGFLSGHEASRLFYTRLGVLPAIIVYRAVSSSKRFELVDGLVGVIGEVFVALRASEKSQMVNAASGAALRAIALSVPGPSLVHAWNDLSVPAQRNLFDYLPADKQDAVGMAFQTEDEKQP